MPGWDALATGLGGALIARGLGLQPALALLYAALLGVAVATWAATFRLGR